MNKILFYIVIALIVFSCATEKKKHEEKDHEEPELITGNTEIEFNEDIHDFGILKSGEVVVFNFIFINTGENNFVIKKLDTGCGCLKANYPKKPVKPGEQGKIEVEFDSSGLFGKQFKSIEIDANTKELKHLAIFAEVQNENLEIIY